MIKFKEKTNWRAPTSVFLAVLMLILPCVIKDFRIKAQATTNTAAFEKFEDNFDREDSQTIGNDWTVGAQAVASISSNQLNLSTTTPSSADRAQTSGAALMRPMTEAALNQVITADFQSVVTGEGATSNGRYGDQGGVIIARCQGETATATNCYRLVVRLGVGGANSTKAFVLLYGTESNNNTEPIWADTATITTMSSAERYRVELTVTSIWETQTQLDIKLYGINTDGSVWKTYLDTTVVDDDPNLQQAGTAGVSVYDWNGGAKISVDNFSYVNNTKEEGETAESFTDDFDRNDGDIGNDWVLGSKAVASISSNAVTLATNHQGNYNAFVSETAVLRPMSEASLNQLVSADFQSIKTDPNQTVVGQYADQGGAIILRCQGNTATDTNCYRLYARLGCDGSKNWKTTIHLYNSLGEIYTTNLSMASNQKYRLELGATSVSETETQLTIKFCYLDAEGNITGTVVNTSVTDNDPNLQKAGTVGFSMYDRWGGELNVDNFSYTVLPETQPEEGYPADDIVPMLYEDDFEGENGNIHEVNGWIDQQYLINNVNAARIEDGKLIIDNGDYKDKGAYTYKLMRPLSEATLNQRVGVDILNLDEIEEAEIELRIIEIAGDSSSVNRQAFYGLLVGKGFMVFSTKISWGQGEIAGTEFDYVEGHTYRVVATAQGGIPTVMTATLYDLTDGGKVVATLTARDQTLLTSQARSAQQPGTVSLSYRGEAPAVFDNFVYEQMDEKIYHDSFNRENGAPSNDWVAGSSAANTAVTSTQLVLNNGGVDNIWNASMMRSITEKTIEQTVAIEYSRPDAASNSAAPVVFARAQTDKAVSIDGTNGFACYYADVTYTGDWSAKLSVYKVAADGTRTLLTEQTTTDYGRKSTAKVRLMLLAQGTNPTKLNAIFYAVLDTRHIQIFNVTVYDNQPELQAAGTAGISYSNSTSTFAISKFSFLKSQELPAEVVVPEDLSEDYMAYFTGTVKAGDFGQWVEVDPNKTYIYSVRIKKISNSGGFGIALRYSPHAWGHMYKNFAAITSTSDLDNCIETVEFKAPSDAQVLPNGKVRIRVIVHEGGLSSTGYAANFQLYEKDDPDKTNLLVNPDFKKGFFGWAGHGYYIQGAEEGGVMKTLGSGEVELVPYDELVFVRDDSDEYFDDGDWASVFESDLEDTTSNGIIKGRLLNSSGKALSGVTVLLSGDIQTKTDKKGYFEFANLPPEIYWLSIRLKDGTECEFDEMLVIVENSDLELELTYEGDESVIEMEPVPATGDKTKDTFPIIVLIFALSVMICVISYKKIRKN